MNEQYFIIMKTNYSNDRPIGPFQRLKNFFCRTKGNKKIEGNIFFEKIIQVLSARELKENGFSEYETYGNFVLKNYPEIYTVRRLRTLREGKILLGDCPNKEMIKWAGHSYDIISLEKYHRMNPVWGRCAKSFLHHFISMEDMWNLYKKIYTGKYYE